MHMKYSYVLILTLALALITTGIISPTLARYSTEHIGEEAAFVAKWNFRVGDSQDNLHNLGFTFDVFDGEALEPQAKGSNTFYVSGGKSDVAIDYEIYMNVQVFTDIGWGSGGDNYPPLIFKISGQNDAEIEEPYDDWFGLEDINADGDGYFRIAYGHIESDSDELVPITVHWWWNTSFYVGEPNTNVSVSGNYYAVALEEYYALVDEYNDRVGAANAFWDIHERIVTTDIIIVGEGEEAVEQEVETVTYSCPAECEYASDAEHRAAYDVLLKTVDDAMDDIDDSIKVRYDDYDTRAISALSGIVESSPQGVMLKVIGDQVTPQH